jgi:hypothetical protein
VWDGTPDRVVERPQPFETFGGPRSGGLASLAVGPEDVVVGTWDDDGPGLDTRLWTRVSPRLWQRAPGAVPLASSATLLPQPAAAAWSSDGLVVAGSVTDLGRAAVAATRATAWTAPATSGPWTRHDLPATTTSARATGVACDGERCWVVGLDGGAPAAWLLESGTVTDQDLPAVAATPDAPPSVATTRDHTWVVLAGRDRAVLARTGGRGWFTVEGPSGRPVSMAALPGRLCVVTATATGTRLWTAPVG